MPAIGHPALTGHPHLAEGRRIGGEHQCVQRMAGRHASQAVGLGIQHQQVGACPRLQAPGADPGCCRAAGQVALEQPRCRGVLPQLRRGSHVALASIQALAVFQQP
jgi:hypothetical protein